MTQEYIDQTRDTARQSETGRRMTDSQFEEAWQVTGIMRREIEKSASFISKLTDYAHAFARDERFDAARGEMVIRDLYAERYGETMNETREALLDREANVRDDSQDFALDQARSVLNSIQEKEDMPFWKALDRGAVRFAGEQGISETAARSVIKEAFENAEGQDFYKTGKSLEEKHYQVEGRIERRSQRNGRSVSRRAPARSGPSRS